MGFTETIQAVTRVKKFKSVRFDLKTKFDLRMLDKDNQNILVRATRILIDMANQSPAVDLGVAQRVQFRRKLEMTILREIYEFVRVEEYMPKDDIGETLQHPNKDDVREIYTWMEHKLTEGFNAAFISDGKMDPKAMKLCVRCMDAMENLRDEATQNLDESMPTAPSSANTSIHQNEEVVLPPPLATPEQMANLLQNMNVADQTKD